VVPVPLLAVILTILFLRSGAASLEAQAPERRPSAAMFGAPDPRQSPEEDADGGLSVSGSLFGAYGDPFLGDQGTATSLQPHPWLRGSYYGFDGRLLYDRLLYDGPGEQLSLRMTGASSASYYPAIHRFAVGRQLADISSSWTTSPWRSARVSTGGAAQYSQYGLPFTEAAASLEDQSLETPDADDLLGSRRRNALQGYVPLQQDWGRGKSIGVLSSLQSSGFAGSDRVNGYGLGGTFNARVARDGMFRAGYTRQAVDRGVVLYSVHHANLGGDYGRPLSTSRRAFVSFRGGSAALESNGQVRVFITADASLNYELKRSWTGRLRYNRGFTFVDEIADPLLSDGLSADLNGLLSRRIDLSGSGSFRHGTVGVSRTAGNYDVYGARTRIRFALSRISAVYAEYLFFHYRFADSVRLGASLPSLFDRQTVRVGVTVMTQLLR
jgi:hypothetical protein